MIITLILFILSSNAFDFYDATPDDKKSDKSFYDKIKKCVNGYKPKKKLFPKNCEEIDSAIFNYTSKGDLGQNSYNKLKAIRTLRSNLSAIFFDGGLSKVRDSEELTAYLLQQIPLGPKRRFRSFKKNPSSLKSIKEEDDDEDDGTCARNQPSLPQQMLSIIGL